MADHTSIESILQEDRVFEPPSGFSASVGGSHIGSMAEYEALYRHSIENPDQFWADAAAEFEWFSPWNSVCEWSLPDARWFSGGTTNIAYNCLDRQIKAGHGDETALLWEGEPVGDEGPDIIRYSYSQLHAEVCRCANSLRSMGVCKGDIVTLYMGMVPELAIAMLACARIGAPHSIIFGGFSAQAIAERVVDASSRTIITCDGSWRRGMVIPLKQNVDDAIAKCGNVDQVLVVQRTASEIGWTEGRDHWWHEVVPQASADCPCEHMDSEDMLFLLYTSGSTGKPKGIIHTTGGYMVQTALTARYTFNLVPDRGQVYWCTADIGWITGHSYIIYGVLPNRVPTLMYEGAPNYPAEDRFWEICERHRVTQFYTAPTAIRAFMKWGEEHPSGHDLSALQVLGTVGEPINPEAWMWYHRVIGGERCPIVDTWWQTETGGHMIAPMPGATPTVPGSCTLPCLGIDAAIVNEEGAEQPAGSGGLLAIRKPWPGMLRGIHGDRQRFIDTYWSRIDGMYFTGDGARRDERGYFWIMGRVDDVINVSGHRLGTMEVESALVAHEAVVEAAVVGMPHEIKGTGIAAFCTLEPGSLPEGEEETERLVRKLRDHVAREIGAIAKPDLIRFSDLLPKTRSGKIMRRLLRDIAAGVESDQDITTLEDSNVMAQLRGET